MLPGCCLSRDRVRPAREKKSEETGLRVRKEKGGTVPVGLREGREKEGKTSGCSLGASTKIKRRSGSCFQGAKKRKTGR